MEEEKWSETRKDFAVADKDCEEAKIKTAKGKAEEINVHVSEIKIDHLDMNFDLFCFPFAVLILASSQSF